MERENNKKIMKSRAIKREKETKAAWKMGHGYFKRHFKRLSRTNRWKLLPTLCKYAKYFTFLCHFFFFFSFSDVIKLNVNEKELKMKFLFFSEKLRKFIGDLFYVYSVVTSLHLLFPDTVNGDWTVLFRRLKY